MRLLFTLFFVLLISVSHGQNLVPNGSFEEHNGCPQEFSETNFLENWFRVNGTPDYYHKCGSSGFGIPNLWYGFQQTSFIVDSGFCGFLIQKFDPWREILAVKLKSALSVGNKYYLSFLFSATKSGNQADCFANNFGVKLLTYEPLISLSSDSNLVDNRSTYKIDQVIVDTANWIKITTSFIADSAYEYLALGYFYQDSLINFICNVGLRAYQYVDQICLTADSGNCYEVFANDPIQVQFIASKNELHFNNVTFPIKLAIYNYIGQIVVKEFSFSSLYELDLISGIYFVLIDDKYYLKILINH